MKNKDITYDSIESLLKDSEPKIPPGTYYLKLRYWETRIMFGKVPKIILRYVIIDGEYAGVKIPAYYNAKKLTGRHGKNGDFVVGKKSNFSREFFKIMESTGTNVDKMRFDRLPVTKLTIVQGDIRTVKVVNKIKLAEKVQYSVINELLPP